MKTTKEERWEWTVNGLALGDAGSLFDDIDLLQAQNEIMRKALEKLCDRHDQQANHWAKTALQQVKELEDKE